MIFLSKVLKLALNRGSSKYRHGLEIARDMLLIMVVKRKKTRIMYQANLSYKLAEKYLGSLLESGLVECVEDSFYVITGRGKEFLQLYEEYVEKCKEIGEEIGSARKDRLLLEDLCFGNRSGARARSRRVGRTRGELEANKRRQLLTKGGRG